MLKKVFMGNQILQGLESNPSRTTTITGMHFTHGATEHWRKRRTW